MPGVIDVAGCDEPADVDRAAARPVWTAMAGRRVEFQFEDVTDDFAETMDVKLASGRWFGPEDDASPDRPVVINRRLALSALSDPDPIGRDLLGDAPACDPASGACA